MELCYKILEHNFFFGPNSSRKQNKFSGEANSLIAKLEAKSQWLKTIKKKGK